MRSVADVKVGMDLTDVAQILGLQRDGPSQAENALSRMGLESREGVVSQGPTCRHEVHIGLVGEIRQENV